MRSFVLNAGHTRGTLGSQRPGPHCCASSWSKGRIVDTRSGALTATSTLVLYCDCYWGAKGLQSGVGAYCVCSCARAVRSSDSRKFCSWRFGLRSPRTPGFSSFCVLKFNTPVRCPVPSASRIAIGGSDLPFPFASDARPSVTASTRPHAAPVVRDFMCTICDEQSNNYTGNARTSAVSKLCLHRGRLG